MFALVNMVQSSSPSSHPAARVLLIKNKKTAKGKGIYIYMYSMTE